MKESISQEMSGAMLKAFRARGNPYEIVTIYIMNGKRFNVVFVKNTSEEDVKI